MRSLGTPRSTTISLVKSVAILAFPSQSGSSQLFQPTRWPREGGCLVHASSAVRNGMASLFAGDLGAGKTTIFRLAPPDANVLTDEISYVRKEADGYCAYGTPFAGDLARPGDNMKAPLAAVYLLAQGPENKIEHIASVPSLPGCHTQAKSLDELMERIREAIEVCLEVQGSNTEPLDFIGVQRVTVVA